MKRFYQITKSLLIKILFVFIAILYNNVVFSQNEATQQQPKNVTSYDLGADIVSNYVWRGMLLDPTPSVQGYVELSKGGFFTGFWASTNFVGTYIETDFYLGYNIGNLTATITDYFGGTSDVFNFKSDETAHAGELMLQYVISDNFPLQITAGSVLWGADLKLDSISIDEEEYFSSDRNYSTYLELMYPATLAEVDFEFSVGGVTHESYFYGTTGAGLTNVSVKAIKTLNINESFALPISFQVTFNPEQQGLYSTFCLTF